jgi:hypothetical protein
MRPLSVIASVEVASAKQSIKLVIQVGSTHLPSTAAELEHSKAAQRQLPEYHLSLVQNQVLEGRR